MQRLLELVLLIFISCYNNKQALVVNSIFLSNQFQQGECSNEKRMPLLRLAFETAAKKVKDRQ